MWASRRRYCGVLGVTTETVSLKLPMECLSWCLPVGCIRAGCAWTVLSSVGGDSSPGRLDVPSGTFTKVSAGTVYSCGLRTDGTVECWYRSSSKQIDVPSGVFTAVSTGGGHSCGLRSGGNVECWGDNDFGQADAPGGTFTEVSAGGLHSCGLRDDASITCWGSSWYGQVDAPDF